MAEGDARDYVLAFENNKTEANTIAQAAASKLQNKETTLIQVVQALGEYINDNDEKIRARAVNYLTEIIIALPDKFLTRQQIQVLNDFLCDRIEDGGAVEGLSQLQGLDRYTNEMTQSLFRSMVSHFDDLRSRSQSARYKVLTLLNDLLNNHRKGIRDMGDESLTRVVSLVAGEKDPRNLMLVFSMLRVIMVEWDISKHIDILFDAVYAYFPITFRPPPNDPYGITAQDLKDRLKDCLSCTGALSVQAFPNLLDRLDSTSDTVKKDVLQALAACALNYEVGTINQYSITLWDAVKFEVLQAQEPFLADEALLVIKNIARCLSKSTNQSPTSAPLVQYLKPVNKECLEHLQEPASRQAKASGDILKAAASASVESFEVVMKAVGPALFTIHQNADSIIAQRAILEVTNQMFEAAIEVYGSWLDVGTKNPGGKENLLLEFKDKLVALYSQTLMSTVKEEVSFRLVAARGLLLLSQMRSYLQDNEIGLFVQYYDEIVLDEESYGRDELKKTAMTALADIAKFKPHLITDITFPAFMSRLPEDEDRAVAAKDYRSVLEGLSQISFSKSLLETLMRRLLNKLDLLLQGEARSTYTYTCAILSTVYCILERTVSAQDVSLDPYYERVVVGLGRNSAITITGPLADNSVLDLIGRTMNLIAKHSDSSRYTSTADNVYILFRDASILAADRSRAVVLNPPSAAITSTWLLASLPRDVQFGVLQPSLIPRSIQDLAKFAEISNNSASQFSCLRQIALYVNKHLPSSELSHADEMLSTSYARLKSGSEYSSFDLTLRLVFVLSKALILRLAPRTNSYLEELVSLLDPARYNAELVQTAASGFGTILANDDVLSKSNNAQIRLLAPQRVFQTLVPLFSFKIREANSPAEKESYLIALSGILGTVSSDIVMPELPTLLPLLLQALDLSDQSVKIATLDTLAVVITRNPTALQESGHISALIKRLLNTAAPAKPTTKATSTSTPISPADKTRLCSTNLPHVRRQAVHCMTLLPKHITAGSNGANPLLPLKKEVLQKLMAVLDDPKRDVRKEGVDARAAWIRGVDDIDSDDDDD